jgi:hypothetical protein
MLPKEHIAVCSAPNFLSPDYLMSPDRFYESLEAAESYLQRQQEALQREYGLDWNEQYQWDQDAGILTLSASGTPKLSAEIQIVGSISTRTKTWLWAWDNPSVSDKVKLAAREMKAFGEIHHIPPFTLGRWEGEESDGWNMTALTAHTLQARGAYRTPVDGGYVYMIITAAYIPRE